jgi:hypothetical protein
MGLSRATAPLEIALFAETTLSLPVPDTFFIYFADCHFSSH